MKTISKLEKIQYSDIKDSGINRTFYLAYHKTQETINETIDFNDVIWESDIEEIIKHCKAFCIDEFTISSKLANIIDIIAEFEQKGCKLIGLTKVKTTFIDFKTQTPKTVNAFKLQIK